MTDGERKAWEEMLEHIKYLINARNYEQPGERAILAADAELKRLRAEVVRLKKECDDLGGDNFIAALANANIRIKVLEEAVEWACSKEALNQSMRLPNGCSGMNRVERITAEICIENLQVGLRRRAKGEG